MSNPKYKLFYNWAESEAALIESDGCSKVTGAYKNCCFVHDLSYYYAKDPINAYKLYLQGELDPWREARAIDQKEADKDLRRCMQSQSKFGWWSPMAGWRWLGLRIAGRKAWEGHRKREQELEE